VIALKTTFLVPAFSVGLISVLFFHLYSLFFRDDTLISYNSCKYNIIPYDKLNKFG
jgi:hypothetical protein